MSSLLWFVGIGIIAADAAAIGAHFGLLISIVARLDAYVSITVRPDVEVELHSPFKVASSAAIIFIGVDATEDAARTVVAKRARFDTSFGCGGGGSAVEEAAAWTVCHFQERLMLPDINLLRRALLKLSSIGFD